MGVSRALARPRTSRRLPDGVGTYLVTVWILEVQTEGGGISAKTQTSLNLVNKHCV